MKISIIDELNSQTHSAIEVEIILSDDSRRWCYFVNSDSMHNFGDCINKTNIRLHYGSPHMIVVAGEITKNIIEQVLTFGASLDRVNVPL